MRQFLLAVASLVVLVAFLAMFTDAIQNPVYQNGLTTRFDALQQTKRVQAQQWGDTARTWGMWGGGALALVGGLVAIGWTVRHWQEQRTKRHEASEEHTTQRHLITAKKDIALAYLALCGDPGAFVGQLEGQRGVFLPRSGEFVPESICRAELASAPAAVPTTALARRQPQTINVPAAMAPDDWLPVGLPGDSDRRFIVRGGW